jgi:starch phosphorylase
MTSSTSSTNSTEDDRRLSNLRARARERMVERLRERGLAVADSDALWLGWAGPLTASSRPALLLRDLARLERLLDDPLNAVRFAIAGEPGDAEGHVELAKILELAGDARFDGRVVFVSGAGAEQILVEGVDVWLGASVDDSSVAAMRSGAIHIPEIGSSQAFDNSEARHEHDARTLYELLEGEIVPSFYAWNSEGIPLAWVARIRASMHAIPRS